MPAVWTAQKKIQMDDTSHSNGEQKIGNGWCETFERLRKIWNGFFLINYIFIALHTHNNSTSYINFFFFDKSKYIF